MCRYVTKYIKIVTCLEAISNAWQFQNTSKQDLKLTDPKPIDFYFLLCHID